MPQDHPEIKSEGVQELLSSPPRWIIRWGISVIFLILVSIFALSSIIQYPDTINGSAIINTESPPQKLVSPFSGKISNIYVSDGEFVQPDQTLLELENPTDSSAIFYMQSILQTFRNFHLSPEDYVSYTVDSGIPVGEMQSFYDQFAADFNRYKSLQLSKFYEQQLLILEQSLQTYRQILTITRRQMEITESEIKNEEVKYNAEKKLYEKGSITRFDFIEAENRFLSRQKEMESMRKMIAEYELRIVETEKSIFEKRFEQTSEIRQLVSGITSSLNEIKNYLDGWKQKYQITASVDGRLVYLTQLNEGQYITQGKEVLAIIRKEEKWQAKVQLSGQGLGKIKPGQAVRIHINNYPSNEYGMLEGKVKSISVLPRDSAYEVTVNLPEQLKTTYNKTLNGQPEMRGFAEIITENKSILHRVLSRFKDIF